MVNELKKIFVAFLVGSVIGAGLVVYLRPSEQTKTVEVEKIKTQTVTVIQKPDGTKITKTEDKVKDIKTQKSQTSNTKAQYALTGGYSIHDQSLSIGVDRRIMGPLWAGIEVSDEGRLGVNVKWEF